jgi:hypothetical protein
MHLLFFVPVVPDNKFCLTEFQNVISRILKADAPSHSAKSVNYIKSQIAYSICDGRYKAEKPRTAVSLPVQLFHPAFGHFLDMDNDKIDIPDDIILQTTKYMIAASAVYESETVRYRALTPLLSDIIDMTLKPMTNEDHTSPDAGVEKGDKASYLLSIKENKNEFGDGHSDPSTQAGLSAGRSWAQPRVCDPYHSTCCLLTLCSV